MPTKLLVSYIHTILKTIFFYQCFFLLFVCLFVLQEVNYPSTSFATSPLGKQIIWL